MTVEHVPGRHAGHIMLYALSTCGWCAKTRKLLEELGVEYDFQYVDNLSGDEREQAMREIKHWNPSTSFPTIVINDEASIVGFEEDKIRGALDRDRA